MKSDLSLTLRRVRHTVHTNVNTGGNSRTQGGGTCGAYSSTNPSSEPDPTVPPARPRGKDSQK